MIEKLEARQVKIPDNPMVVKWMGMDNESLFNKINELVDVVNELQTKVNKLASNINFAQPEVKENNATISKMEKVETPAESSQENVQDPYVDRLRWIGKLCWFWDDDTFGSSNDCSFGILSSIDKGILYKFWCNGSCPFKHCEPVKPDDPIIYKGGNNE